VGPGRTARRAVAVAAAVLLAAPVAASARDMYATDGRNVLMRFDSRFPGVITDRVGVTGLGGNLVGIDFRPSTGEMVGVAADNRVYVIDADSGAARPVGLPFVPGLSGASFGVEVNPVTDTLRVVSDAGQNIRLDLTSGAHVPGSPFTPLNPSAPHVVAIGYANSSFSATRPPTTVLAAIDSASDQVVIGAGDAGTLGNGKPLGIDIGDAAGADGSFIPGVGDVAYMVATPRGASGASLFRVSLVTGRAFRFGPVGTGSPFGGRPRLTLTGFAIRQAFGLPARNIPPDVRIVPSARPRPRIPVVYLAYATDHDGGVERVVWDTDGDGAFDDFTGERLRRAFPAGTRTLRVRVTDNSGARTTDTLRIVISRS
jgi:hypothetical protein